MSKVAIVGIGCRFPGGVHDARSYWEFLMSKGDGVVEIPRDRWNVDKYYDEDPDAPGRMYTRRGGFLTDSVKDFDPEFFGISPREAAIMDPQQRLMLEVAWESLDDAGLAGRVNGRNVGVYVGGFTGDNGITRVSMDARLDISGHTAMSYTFTLLSNRISYGLNLTGPSMTIDTACSSSLVAFHEAVRSVLGGECEMALAGGVNVMLQPETYVSMSKGRFLAVDGRSKAFDASADGYGRGEGAGVVVIKKLDDALRDGDRIYAVVRGTGVNQDGKTAAIPVPNPLAQEDLARRVSREAGLAPEQIRYVEAHGTGTPVGDPLEVSALGKVYGVASQRKTPLAIGSVKASIGHLEAAAGIAGLIKSALVVHHRTIAPQGWLERLNPEIPFEELRLYVPTDSEPLTDPDVDMTVAINSFGYGGTNAHAILSQAPSTADRTAAPEPVFPVLPISGRNPSALRELADRFAQLLEDGADLDAVTAAAWTRRAHHQFRAAFDYTDQNDLLTKLSAYATGKGRAASRIATGAAAEPVFVLSGMGPQWWAMARDLLRRDGEFSRTAANIDEEFRAIAGWSIVAELLRDEDDSQVARTTVAQPANFLVQVALVAELASLGVHPKAVVGHSVGEVAAAYVCGALSLTDALRVSYHRSRLQAQCGGGMIAVGLSEEDALAAVPEGDELAIAAVNGPTGVTLAGDLDAVERLFQKLSEAGTFARMLRVEVAYHSHLMDPILGELRSVLGDLEPRTPSLPLYSTVDGQQVTGPTWDANYWCRNVRESVRFADTINNLLGEDNRVFLEVGPNPVLSGNIREILIRGGQNGTVIGTLSRKEGDMVSLRRAIGELYVAGALDGTTIPGGNAESGRHVALPAYPWQRSYLWTEAESVSAAKHGSRTRYPMLGQRTEPVGSEWVQELSASMLPWLRDHVVEDRVVLPGAAYLDAALCAASIRTGREDLALEDVRFVTPLVIDAHDIPFLKLAVEESTRRFTISSRPANGSTWTVNATGRLVEAQVRPAAVQPPEIGDDAAIVLGEQMYPALAERGLRYGPAFQGIIEARVSADIVIASVDASVAADSKHLVHPAVLDVALQCVAALAATSDISADGAIVPAGVRTVRRYGPIPEQATVVVRRCVSDAAETTQSLFADIDILDSASTQVISLSGVEFRSIAPASGLLHRLSQIFYEPSWEIYETPVDLPSDAELASEFVLIVGLGKADRWVASVTARLANVSLYWVEDALSASTEDVIADLLRAGLGADGIERATVLTVAGNGPGTQANTHALARIAAAVSEVAAESGPGVSIRAAVVTQRGISVPGDAGIELSHAALVGARRTLLNEQPTLGWRLIDTAPDTSVDAIYAEALSRSAAVDPNADEVCLRQAARWVLRVRPNLAEHLEPRNESAPVANPETSYKLEIPGSRLLGDLSWRVVDRVEPEDGQVEIRMDALGLNPKDVFKVLGVLSAEDMDGTFFGMDLGLEGAGTIVRVGPGVQGVAVGDKVGVCARDMMRRYLTVDQSYVTVVPSAWPAAACSSNVPFLTAELALLDSARLGAGETVLIHGGAGGVGLAAIQIARHQGATVIATASNDERRAYVLEAGAHHAVDSRSMNFVDEVMRLTDGRGVDVVLNSAPGEIIRQNFRVAAEFGRIVDIGKVDIYGSGVIDLRPFDRNLTFTALDLDRMMNFRPEVVQAKTIELVEKFRMGVYRHLPYQTFSADDVAVAFDAIVRPRQIGRVVLDLQTLPPVVKSMLTGTEILPTAAYLVTGGFGSFGLATARWLVREGARHLILAGRFGAATPEARAQLLEFEAAGVRVVEQRVDVSNFHAVSELVARTADGPAPLRGIFHAAGVVDNSPVPTITADTVSKVFLPKVDGAINLDRVVREAGIALDHFVLWSSISGLIGGFPQFTYSAANATLQSLAHARHARGEAALCIDWGSMAGGGMAEADEETVRYLAAVGLRPIDMDAATDYLAEAIRLHRPHVALFDMDWAQASATTPAVKHSARFAEFAGGVSADQDAAAARRSEILALPVEEQGAAITSVLAEVLAVVMGVTTDSVDTETPLLELGIDSLMAVEFAARTAKVVGVELSPVEMASGLGLGLSGIGAKVAAELDGAVGKSAA